MKFYEIVLTAFALIIHMCAAIWSIGLFALVHSVPQFGFVCASLAWNLVFAFYHYRLLFNHFWPNSTVETND